MDRSRLGHKSHHRLRSQVLSQKMILQSEGLICDCVVTPQNHPVSPRPCLLFGQFSAAGLRSALLRACCNDASKERCSPILYWKGAPRVENGACLHLPDNLPLTLMHVLLCGVLHTSPDDRDYPGSSCESLGQATSPLLVRISQQHRAGWQTDSPIPCARLFRA